MHVAALTLQLRIPGCSSLKEKRSRLTPLLHSLHRQFNVSAAEIDRHDHHTLAVVAVVVVSNDSRHAQRLLSRVPGWMESHRPDLQIIDEQLLFL